MTILIFLIKECIIFSYFRFKLAWLKNDERNSVKNNLKDEYQLFLPLEILPVENTGIVHSNIGKKKVFSVLKTSTVLLHPKKTGNT